jgi:hypothetical protein
MAAPVIVQNQVAQPGNTNVRARRPDNNLRRDELTKPASIEIPKYQYFGSYLRIFGEMW